MEVNKGFKTPKILFVDNTPVWYINPFYKKLSEACDVKLIFTHPQLCESMYSTPISQAIKGLEGVNYKLLKNRFGIAFGLIKELVKNDYDILVDEGGLVIEMLFSFTIAKLIRRKSLISLRSNWGWKGKRPLRWRLGAPFGNFITRHSDAIVVPGTKQKEYYPSLIPPERIFIMPYARSLTLNEEDYERKEKLHQQLDIGNKKVVLYVGRLVKQKGVEFLIKAFQKLAKERNDVILIIIGEGEQRVELEQLSKNLGIESSVYFAGFVENVNLPPYYLLCDVCVVPSTTYGQADVWASIVNEAMSAGKPVIATDAVGAAFDMVKDGINGFMVPERDSDALYSAMKKVLSNPELARKMGEESKRIVEEGFKNEHMVEGFMKAVESIKKRGNTS